MQTSCASAASHAVWRISLQRFGRLAGVLAAAGGALSIAACSTVRYTVDDGRKVDETLLANMRLYGAGERALRPAIARTAALNDPACATQFELPISVASSDAYDPNERVAWVRALGVDERLTVIAAVDGAGFSMGDKIAAIAGVRKDDAEKMTLELAERRDAGKPFDVVLASGRSVRVAPFKVCRGYARLAAPNTPRAQDYHWLVSMHPLEVAAAPLTDDEALWAVLWSQGLSEEGGARMKTYHYGVKIASALYDIFTIATGLKGVAVAASLATAAAKSAATAAATEVLKRQLIEQASQAAQRRVREELTGIAQKLTQKQVASAMQQAAANRGNLFGVARVGATVFDRADTWAFSRMVALQANPLAGFTLHQKLIESGATSNALVFDVERLESVNKVAQASGLDDQVVAILKGIRPDRIGMDVADMPQASRADAFSYEDPIDIAADQPFARGLIDGLLELPVESKRAP